MSFSVWNATVRRLAAPGAAVAVALATLSACGGGGGGTSGGGDNGVVAPAQPTLSLTSDATSTTSAGASIALHAAQTHSTSTPTWTLTGPGSLSASTGTDITYTPPDGESLAQASSATVGVSADGLSSQVVISVGVGSVAGQHWTTSHAVAPSWNSVTFDAGTFVAIGTSGGLWTSTDGQHWTSHDTSLHSWQSVAHGTAGWVAIAADGSVATSTDGLAWAVDSTALPGVQLNTWLTQVVFGDGVYIVGSQNAGSWISTDGLSWTQTAHSFSSLATGGGTLVGIEGSNAYASSDGVNWSPVSPGAYLNSLAYANGMFAGTSANGIMGSTDGVHWTLVGTTAYTWDSLFSDGNAFYQAGSSTATVGATTFLPGAIAASTDGQQWSYRNQTATGIASGFAQGAGQLVVVSNDGSIGSGPNVNSLQTAVGPSSGGLSQAGYANGKYLALSDRGNLLASADGQSWSSTAIAPAAWPGTSATLTDPLMASAASGRIVVWGWAYTAGVVSSAIVYSDDGISWSVASLPTTDEMTTLLHDGTRFLAFTGGDVYASSDGSAWSHLGSIAVQNSQWVKKAVYAHGLYIAVGPGGLVASSVDAVNWTVAPTVMDHAQTPAAVDLNGVVYAGNRFVAVGAGGNVATSTDGSNWSVAATATTQWLNAIAASPQGELVVVDDLGLIETSIDAVHWTLRNSAASAGLQDIVFANGAFLAVGYDGFIEMSTR